MSAIRSTLLPVDGEKPGEPQSSPLRVVEADFREDPRWLDFLSSHRDALIYHHPGWLAALENEYGRRCIALACEGSDGVFQGVLPLLLTRGLPLRLSRHQVGRRLSSLPRTPLAGPLASNSQALAALLRAALQLVQGEPNLQLELKTTTPDLDKIVPELQCVRWRDTYVRGLPTNENPAIDVAGHECRIVKSCESCDTCRVLRFGSSRENHQVRWAANKATRQGISLRPARDEDDLRTWYQIYLRTMRRNAVPPRPFRFFQQLWKELQPLGHIELLLAERDENRPDASSGIADSESWTMNRCSDHLETVSGSIFLQFGQTVFWAFSGSDERNSNLHANDLTLWRYLHNSCKLGYKWCDLGEVAESHPELAQFKAKWGTFLQPMYRYYYPAWFRSAETEADSAFGLVTRAAKPVLRQLPLRAVAALGDCIFRYL